MSRRAIVLAVFAAGIAVGIYSLVAARNDPVYSFAGASVGRDIALLAAGWSLIVCGLAYWERRSHNPFGPLLVAAGFVWFLPEWSGPGIGSALAFTIGLVFYGLVTAAVVGHAVLAYPGGRLRFLHERVSVAVAYLGSLVVLGVLPALFFDPRAPGCGQCPRNLLLVTGRPGAVDDLDRVGTYLGLAWGLALALLVGLRLVRVTSAVRPVLAAGVAYLGLVAAEFAASLDRGFVTNSELELRLWLGQAVALAGISVAVLWALARGRRARSQAARLIVDLGQAPPPGGLRDVLAGIVGDPELLLAYPLAGSARLIDADGRSVDVSPRQQQSTLVRNHAPVAVLGHAPGLLDDEQLVEEVTAAARLALENERLRAEACGRLEELRASQTRIVAAGDAERRRLERDLHDGAQQRLVALGLSLRLVRSQLEADADLETVGRLDLADALLAKATSELRELAHGIFPAVLADGGLSVAVHALAEDSRVPVHVGALPEGRFPESVETAAYSVVSETARSGGGGLVVSGERRAGMLAVEVETEDLGELDVGALRDRLEALDGRLDVRRDGNGRVTIRARVPCGS